MDFAFIHVPLLAASILLLVSMVSGVYSTRLGFPVLLIFLFAGALAGEDGIGGYHFSDFALSFWVGNVALAIILLDGGLRTPFETFRTGLRPSLVLATVGVALSAAVTGLAAMALMGLDWRSAMLLGAIVGSTDAAAVFALLKRSGVTLNERVAATLEIESGMNDPMAVYLTLAFITLIVPAQAASPPGPGALALLLVQQFGWGAMVGISCGLAMTALVNRSLRDAEGGVMALIVCAAGLAVFSGTGLLGGSGFLAVYLFGLVLANRARQPLASALSAMDGYAWLAQAGMFLLLGLLVTPHEMARSAGPALGVAAALMFLARPASVWVCLLPFRFRPREVWFISWVGLRGAVPIVLAVFPLLAGVPQAMLLFNAAFAVVLASLLLQGTTIGIAARRLGVTLPDQADEHRVRAVFGDFTLDADAPVGSVTEFYGLPLPRDAHLPLREWVAAALGRPAVVGDSVALGSASLSVRAMDGPRITVVGLKLEDGQA